MFELNTSVAAEEARKSGFGRVSARRPGRMAQCAAAFKHGESAGVPSVLEPQGLIAGMAGDLMD